MNLEKLKACPQVTLDKTEQELATWLAKKRYETARSHNVKNAKIGPQSNHLTDLEGIASELAFCKIVNVFPDLTVGPRKGGYDCLITNQDLKADVKATKYKTGRLLARTSKSMDDSDVYVLMIGEFPTYSFVGWAWNHELLLKENIINLGHGDGYALTQELLHPPRSIFELTRRASA
jgi:hypothetical protein